MNKIDHTGWCYIFEARFIQTHVNKFYYNYDEWSAPHIHSKPVEYISQNLYASRKK